MHLPNLRTVQAPATLVFVSLFFNANHTSDIRHAPYSTNLHSRCTTAMAIIDSIPGLEVTVEINNKKAREYKDDPSDDPGADAPDLDTRGYLAQDAPNHYMVRYIEAKPGEFFGIKVHRSPNFKHVGHHIGVRVRVGSCRVSICQDTSRASVRKPGPSSWTEKTGAVLTGNEEDGFQRNNFIFDNLSIVDQEYTNATIREHHLNEAKKIGIIKVEVFNLKYSDQYDRDNNCGPSLEEIARVDEKALKGKAVDCTHG